MDFQIQLDEFKLHSKPKDLMWVYHRSLEINEDLTQERSLVILKNLVKDQGHLFLLFRGLQISKMTKLIETLLVKIFPFIKKLGS